MTVSSTSSRVVYAGTGTQTTWPFAFKVLQATDLSVVYTDSTGTDFPLSPGQYAASGFGLDAGGSVTYPLSGSPIAANTKLTIYRNVALTQPTAISNQGAMWPTVIEAALDRLTYMAQAVSDAVSRTLAVSPTDSASLNTLPGVALRKNSFLGFDGNGQPIAATGIGTSPVATWLATNFLALATSAATACSAIGAFFLSGNNIVSGNNSFSGTGTYTNTNDFTGGRALVPTRAAGDSGTDAASTAFVATAANARVGGAVLRSYLAGLTVTNDGVLPNTVLDISAGSCADSTNTVMITLGAFTKSTAGTWTAGTGNTGMGVGLTIANATWYHVFAIIVTGMPDIYFDASVTAANRPVGTTAFRRIGSFLSNGSAQIIGFIQDGDYFRWKASVLDVADTNPGTSAVTKTLASVPTGVTVQAILNSMPTFASSGAALLVFSDLAANDEAPSMTAAPLANNQAGSLGGGAVMPEQIVIRTNTLAQIRYRLSVSGASDVVRAATLGWIDSRGRNS